MYVLRFREQSRYSLRAHSATLFVGRTYPLGHSVSADVSVPLLHYIHTVISRTNIKLNAIRVIAVSLVRDPMLLARVMEEQQSVLKDPSRPVTYENLGEMELLHNVMREALRVNAANVRDVSANLNRTVCVCSRDADPSC